VWAWNPKRNPSPRTLGPAQYGMDCTRCSHPMCGRSARARLLGNCGMGPAPLLPARRGLDSAGWLRGSRGGLLLRRHRRVVVPISNSQREEACGRRTRARLPAVRSRQGHFYFCARTWSRRMLRTSPRLFSRALLPLLYSRAPGAAGCCAPLPACFLGHSSPSCIRVHVEPQDVAHLSPPVFSGTPPPPVFARTWSRRMLSCSRRSAGIVACWAREAGKGERVRGVVSDTGYKPTYAERGRGRAGGSGELLAAKSRNCRMLGKRGARKGVGGKGRVSEGFQHEAEDTCLLGRRGVGDG
jgi:hypothetical protein